MKSFQEYRLDTVNHCLWKGGERLALAPKTFDVLRYLVEHSDRLVTQEEILETLWPDTYVNPEVVKKYVLEIRKLFGDDPTRPSFVATFPRRGYQFIASVSEGEGHVSADVPERPRKTMVGRDTALAALKQALGKAKAGQRQVIFVTGEAGIGKTTLVDAFQQETVGVSCGRIARGNCVEGFGGKEAYYPVLDAFAHLLNGADESAILQALAKRAPTWLVQFPHVVSEAQREALEKQILGASRERMVREMCEALEAITEHEPLVLCLEDLHWVDPSTLDLLSAIARRRTPAKLLLVLTYRPADVIVSRSPLKMLKQDLVLHDLAREICLERLEEDDIARYIELEFGRAVLPEGFAGAIYRQSGGNTLFMVAILQDLMKKRLLTNQAGVWQFQGPLSTIATNVPETLDQLIEVQFQQLTATEQRVLRAASVAGEHFSIWSIQTATELELAEIESACEGLVEKRQFLNFGGIHELANGELSTFYEFQHSFYREVLYHRISEVGRSKLHLLIANRLRDFCSACDRELATELAQHFEGGHDYEQAIRHLVLGAETAMRRFSYRDSIEILEHAHGLVSRLNAPLRDELEIRILENIGDSYFALGTLADSAQAYRAAAARAAKAGLGSEQVHALVRAMYPLGGIDPDQGLKAMSDAVQASKGIGDPKLTAYAQMLSSGCHLVFDEWRKSDADLYTSTAAELHGSGSDPLSQMVHGHVLSLFGGYRAAIEAFEGCVSGGDHGSSLITSFGALSGKTFALLRLGNFGEVLRLVRAGMESFEENRTRFWLLSVREAWLRTELFDYAGAVQICQPISEGTEQHREGSEQYRSVQPRAIADVAAGYLALQEKDIHGAVARFSRVHRPDVPTKFFLRWLWRMAAHLGLGNAWLMAGEISKAKQVSASCLESVLGVADPQLRALGWDLCARVSLAEQNFALAQEQIENGLAVLETYEVPMAVWQVCATASEIHQKRKDSLRAERLMARAQEAIMKIASSLDPDEPLRATFLAAEPVRRVLQHLAQQEIAKPAFARQTAIG